MADNLGSSSDSTERIIDIKVNIEEAIQKIVEYQNKIKDVKQAEDNLRKALDDGRITQQKYDTEMEKAKLAKDEYKKSIREVEKEIKNEITQQKAQQGSLRQLRAELSNATKAYDDMSRAERESAAGEALKNHINEVTKELKGAEEETQRFYRNVGNYENSILSALGQNNKFAQSIMALSAQAGSAGEMFSVAKAQVVAFGAALGKLLLNPIVLAIAALVGVVHELNEGIQSSEENTNRWKSTLTPFTAAINVIEKRIQDWAASITKANNNLSVLYQTALGFLHLVSESDEQATKALDNAEKAEHYRREAEARQKDYVQMNAKWNQELAKLQVQLMQTEKYTTEQRKQFAAEYERIMNKQSDALIKLRVAQRNQLLYENKTADNTYETNLKLAQANAAITDAQTEKYTKMRTIERRLNTIAKAEASAQASASASVRASIQSVTKEKEQALKEQERLLKEQQRLLAEMMSIEKSAVQQAEDSLIALIKDGTERRLAEMKAAYDRRVEKIREQLADESKLTITAKKALQQTLINLEEKYNQDVAEVQRTRTEEEIRKTAKANAQATANTQESEEAKTKAREGAFTAAKELTSGLSTLLESAGEDNEAAAQLAKVVALANIAISIGEAIAKMTSAEAGKGIAGVVTMASGIASILANMASAISYVNSAKFATGGDVSGEGTSTSDSVPAMLSDGESVINAKSTAAFAPLLSAINQAGGGVPIYGKQAGGTADINSMMQDATRDLIKSLPAPVVSVTDITDVTNRVRVKERIAKFKK
jgi:hypothetical protein